MSNVIESQPEKFPTTPYRWVILLLFALNGIMTQVIWVSFSAIMPQSQDLYGVNEFAIQIMAVSYMIVYIPMNFPACWAIDKLGLKWGVGVGIILTGAFGLIRGIFARNYTIVLISQIMCAVGQPFVLNSFTKMAVTWFPDSEKATASGLGTISTLIGAVIGVVLPESQELQSEQIPGLLLWYGIITFAMMILYLFFVKEKPEHPPNPYADKTKVLVTKGYRDLLKNRDFLLLMIMLFFGLGIFNAMTSITDSIFDPDIAGLISGMLIGGGVLGAIVLSLISDALHKRKIFLVIGMVAAVPLSALIKYLPTGWLMYALAFLYGFLLISLLPVGITYAAEITFPIQEEVSNGMLMMIGQVGGILFVIPQIIPHESFMYISAGMFAVSAVVSFFLRDTPYYEKLRKHE
jgi:MFS family permease